MLVYEIKLWLAITENWSIPTACAVFLCLQNGLKWLLLFGLSVSTVIGKAKWINGHMAPLGGNSMGHFKFLWAILQCCGHVTMHENLSLPNCVCWWWSGAELQLPSGSYLETDFDWEAKGATSALWEERLGLGHDVGWNLVLVDLGLV